MTVTVPLLSTTRVPWRIGELAPPPMVPVPLRNSFPLPSIEPPRKTKFPFTVMFAGPVSVPLWVRFPTVSGALTVSGAALEAQVGEGGGPGENDGRGGDQNLARTDARWPRAGA